MVVEFESIDRAVEVQAQVLVGVELSRLSDQPVREFRINAPVARLVGIGQRRSPHRLAEAQVVELRGLRRQTGFDVAQALAVGQLREGHRSVLLGTGQRPHPAVAAIAPDNPRKGAPRQKIHDLREQRLADVHRRILGKTPKTAPCRSNRHHASLPRNPHQSCVLNPLIVPATGHQ